MMRAARAGGPLTASKKHHDLAFGAGLRAVSAQADPGSACGHPGREWLSMFRAAANTDTGSRVVTSVFVNSFSYRS